MKKVLSLILALAVLATMCLTFASCGKKLSGTYSNKGPLSDITYEFKGNKVTVTDTVTIGESTFDFSYSGKYKITKEESGTLKIAFTFEDSDAERFNKTCILEEIDGGIKLNGLTYTKNN
jgi:uncharacterized lipoprotein YehR (DUF1307 family)